MSEQPSTDPFSTPLVVVAAQMHEMFRTFVAAGFTEGQALQLVIAALAHAASGGDHDH